MISYINDEIVKSPYQRDNLYNTNINPVKIQYRNCESLWVLLHNCEICREKIGGDDNGNQHGPEQHPAKHVCSRRRSVGSFYRDQIASNYGSREEEDKQ